MAKTASRVKKRRRPTVATSSPEKKPQGTGAIYPGPEELNEPPDDLLAYATCIFGEKGIGKTSLASQFPDSLVIMGEPLRKNLRIRQVPLVPLSVKDLNRLKGETPWEKFKAIVKKALNDDTVQTMVIDTIDRIYEACLTHVCYEKGISDPGELNDYGMTWRQIAQEFESTLNQIPMGDKGLVLISHAHYRDVESRDGEESFQLLIPTCSPAAFRYVKGVCDYAFYYGYHQRTRCMYLRGTDHIWSACGTPDHFNYTDGSPIERIEMEGTPEFAFQQLVSGFNNELDNAGE